VGDHHLLDVSLVNSVQKGLKLGAAPVDAGADVADDVVLGVGGNVSKSDIVVALSRCTLGVLGRRLCIDRWRTQTKTESKKNTNDGGM
jgi:hypothetical protein